MSNMSKKIYFSPSDQTRNIYAVGNTTEAEQCRKIALAAVEAAKRCGFEAKTNVTFGGDAGMRRRVAESNAWGADAHIPIHTNAFNGQVKGTRMFCYDTSGEGYQLCRAILARLAPITPGESDNISKYHFYEVKAAAAPTAYLEVGFHDNREEAQWIIDHTRDIAEAIVMGLCDHYHFDYIAPAGPEAPEQPQQPAEGKRLYRVRRAWEDGYKTQTGAFARLENAKRACPAGYTVFDEDGNAVYTNTTQAVHTVKAGESPWSIAEEYLGTGTRYKELLAYNGLDAGAVIHPGDALKIPAK